jgi:hypothetical protein
MDQREKDIAEMVKKFSAQQNSFMGNNPVMGNNSGMGGGQQPIRDSHYGIDNQGDNYSGSTPITPASIQPGAPPKPAPVGNVCPQCNMMHPPLRPGEKCPNASMKIEKEGKEQSVDINKYLVSLRNILMSQIDCKGSQDVDKLFKNITLEVTKYLEGYKE